jgi:hypothetical protein
MKNTLNLILYLIMVAWILILPNSCYYDEPPELSLNLPEVVSFSEHVLPVFSASCALTGCHDGTTSPNLLEGNAYNELTRGGYISTVFPENGVLYKAISSNSMPPSSPLNSLDRALILKWLEDGAANN